MDNRDENPGADDAGAAEEVKRGVGINTSDRRGGPGLDDERLIREKAPSLWAYLRRVAAVTKSFLRHVVEEEGRPAYGRMPNELATIKVTDGKIVCSSKEHGPTPEETAAIKAELAKASWPRSINVKEARVKDLARRISGRPTLYVFKNEAGDEVSFVQQRIFPKDGGKHDLPWTYWSDGQWGNMEPDGLLPLFGLEQLAGGGAVMIHEGAKTAAYLQWLTSNDAAARKKLAEHPWGEELRHYSHLGWPGGAHRPHGVDWSPIKRLPAGTPVVISCDRDQIGEEAATKISPRLMRPLMALMFDHKFEAGFDLADPWPPIKEWWEGKKYVGPISQMGSSRSTRFSERSVDVRARLSLSTSSGLILPSLNIRLIGIILPPYNSSTGYSFAVGNLAEFRSPSEGGPSVRPIGGLPPAASFVRQAPAPANSYGRSWAPAEVLGYPLADFVIAAARQLWHTESSATSRLAPVLRSNLFMTFDLKKTMKRRKTSISAREAGSPIDIALAKCAGFERTSARSRGPGLALARGNSARLYGGGGSGASRA